MRQRSQGRQSLFSPLLAIPILWLIKSTFSVGQRLLEIAVAASLLYGLGVVVFLLMPVILRLARKGRRGTRPSCGSTWRG